MTPFQILLSLLTVTATFYYAPALWRSDEKLTFGGGFTWATLILLTIVSFVGIRW